MPYKEKKVIERVRFLRMLMAVVGAIILIIITSFILVTPTWLTISSRRNLTKGQIGSLEQDGKLTSGINIDLLQKQATSIQDKLNFPTKTSPTQYIILVRSLSPQGITIDHFSTISDQQTIEVNGVSRDRELLQKFISTLAADSTVASVDNPVSNFIKNKNGTFRLTVTFK